MYHLAVPVALQALTQARHLAGMASADLMATRLHPGMSDLAGQFRTVASFAQRSTFPLTTKASPPLAQNGPLAALEGAETAVRDLSEADFDGAETRRIAHRAGEAELDQSAMDYLLHFAQPNLWFHLSIAYAIMRAADQAIGKADFDGLHHYPAGFSF